MAKFTKNDGKYKSMVLVDIDVAFDIIGSYMMRVTCMLREIELMTLVGVIYIGYIVYMNFTYMLFFIKIW
jgi:hypothetical protein